MYVCLCFGITDKQIHKAMKNGTATRQALARELGIGTQCGCCRTQVAEMVNEFRAQQNEKTATATQPAAGIGLYRPALLTG